MEKIIVNSYDEFASFLGKKLGESEWLEVNQERINLFYAYKDTIFLPNFDSF